MIVGRLLGEFDYEPKVQVAALYLDQVPANDLGVAAAAKHGVPIYKTIAEAVSLGTSGEKADGILLIGEHGNYPTNEKGQKMYPRRRFAEEILKAMDAFGLRSPIFVDKHFSYDVADCCWMYEQFTKRGIPFFGGSSVPYMEVEPTYDRALLGELREAFVISWGGTESYGFHAMDLLQSLAERREGGESGAVSVEAFVGPDMWSAMDRGEWPEALLTAGLAVQPECPEDHPRDVCDGAILFRIAYLDGAVGYVAQLPDFVETWSFAVRLKDGRTVAASCRSSDRPYTHFSTLTRYIEELVLTGKRPCSPARTRFSSCLIDYAMESLHCGFGVATPELQVTYKPFPEI
jgi:hypothetical protein